MGSEKGRRSRDVSVIVSMFYRGCLCKRPKVGRFFPARGSLIVAREGRDLEMRLG